MSCERRRRRAAINLARARRLVQEVRAIGLKPIKYVAYQGVLTSEGLIVKRVSWEIHAGQRLYTAWFF